MRSRDLTGVVVAFDLDNTLLEHEPRAYRDTVEEFLALRNTELSIDACYDAYERIRAWGSLFDRIGLANSSHERGHADALAAMLLLCAPGGLPQGMRSLSEREAASIVPRLDALAAMERAARHGSVEATLQAELDFRRHLFAADDIAMFCLRVRELAAAPDVQGWAAEYARVEARHPPSDVRGPLELLQRRKARVVVITHGRTAVQTAKVNRLGLGDFFSGGIFDTQRIATPQIWNGIRAALDKLVASAVLGQHHDERELQTLWTCHRLMEEWGRKSPAFYGRCLHHLHGLRAGEAWRCTEPVVVRRPEWRDHMRFVMVGDRVDLDVQPITELLGEGAGLKVLLASGKYGAAVEGAHSGAGADRVVADWRALEILLEALEAAPVGPIVEPPRFLPAFASTRAFARAAKASAVQDARTLGEIASMWLDDSG